jgi:hypothetical protein
MTGWSLGVVDGPHGQRMVMNGMDAMYARAQLRGDTELMKILEHRSEKHDGGPCYCEARASHA